jgi:hypothetical protein
MHPSPPRVLFLANIEFAAVPPFRADKKSCKHLLQFISEHSNFVKRTHPQGSGSEHTHTTHHVYYESVKAHFTCAVGIVTARQGLIGFRP